MSLSRTVVGLVMFAGACSSPTGPHRNPTEPSVNRPEPARNWPDLTGTYTLTLSASSRCPLELPEAMRTRRYTATIAQVGGSLVVTVPSTFPGWDNTFTGALDEANDVMFQLQLEEWFLEEPVTEFRAFGRMTATISAGSLSGFLDGNMEGIVPNEDGRGNRALTCTAPDHRVLFTR